jgi:predicted RNA-binding Zn-ribbon protein involved in translation (DUF1610 family)
MIVVADTTQVARIPHRCSECGGLIKPGETYHRQRNIFEREPYVSKAHPECSDAILRRDLNVRCCAGFSDAASRR